MNNSSKGLPLRTVAVALTVAAVPTPALPVDMAAAAPPIARLALLAASTPASSTRTSGASLESAASKAGGIARNVAMSLIGLGFAIAAVVLVFRRDFKEAAGVFAVGLLAILLATPAGVSVLHATVNTLFGSS